MGRWEAKRREVDSRFLSCRGCCEGPDAGSAEPLERVRNDKSGYGVRWFLVRWVLGLGWARIPQRVRLDAFLGKHLDVVVAQARYQGARRGVEALNATIKTLLRRARGIGDTTRLPLPFTWATARPNRSARDLERFVAFGLLRRG